MSMLNEIYKKQYYQNLSNKKKEDNKEKINDSVFIDIQEYEKERYNVKWHIKCGKDRCDCSIM